MVIGISWEASKGLWETVVKLLEGSVLGPLGASFEPLGGLLGGPLWGFLGLIMSLIAIVGVVIVIVIVI